MYTTWDTSADQDSAGICNSSTPAGNSDMAPDWTVPCADAYWTRFSNFVEARGSSKAIQTPAQI